MKRRVEYPAFRYPGDHDEWPWRYWRVAYWGLADPRRDNWRVKVATFLVRARSPEEALKLVMAGEGVSQAVDSGRLKGAPDLFWKIQVTRAWNRFTGAERAYMAAHPLKADGATVLGDEADSAWDAKLERQWE